MKRLFKITAFLTLVLSGMVASVVLIPLATQRRRLVRTYVLHFLSRPILMVLGVRGFFKGKLPKTKGRGRLILANHLSYVDVLIIASRVQAAFVTSNEVRENQVEGWIALSGGSIFVERRSRRAIAHDIRQIQETLEAGTDVVLFPEATSSSGETLLPFHHTLVQAAVNAGATIVPLCVKYEESSRQVVAYYGDMQFGSHLWKLLATENIQFQLEWLPATHQPTCRKQVTTIARNLIQSAHAFAE